MSCIAGIINLDGAPVDRELLERMTTSMGSRAPDDSVVWVSGNVGFGHAMLRISPESKNERQPCTLDNQIWITADARIDGRSELIRKLRSSGAYIDKDAPDPDLILLAYLTLGERFLSHLIGDFAFVIWDGRQSKLIIVRDHFGVRPLFYAIQSHALIFASSIAALLEHPAIDRELDETAVGDFLLFGNYLDEEITIYKNIRRVPAANSILVEKDGRLRKIRYWCLEQPDTVRYSDTATYVEHFEHCFSEAVKDRLPSNVVAIEMSGGMDSTAIAAVAAPLAKQRGKGAVIAQTNVCHSVLAGDREGYYAGMAASYLDIQVNYGSVGDYAIFQDYKNRLLVTDEPLPSPNLAFSYDTFKSMTDAGANVVLNGFAGDAVLAGRVNYYTDLLRGAQLRELFSDILFHWRITGSLRGTGFRALFSSPRSTYKPVFPTWLNKDFADRYRLSERWHYGWECYFKYDTRDQLSRPWASQVLAGYECFQLPLVGRYPFLDTRLVDFLMALPNHIKMDKFILRNAMQGKLPEQIISRPKEGVPGDLIRAKFGMGKFNMSEQEMTGLTHNGYTDSQKYTETYKSYLSGTGKESTFPSDFVILPLALGAWLSSKNLIW